ncbi:hypothetical protein ECZU34_64270 [Escherichia coli]|nr:hypothetical protein ECZU34_64270 [Escherichia coli]
MRWGEADSEEAFAVEFASDTGLLAGVPETVALYFDYEAYARDLFRTPSPLLTVMCSVGDLLPARGYGLPGRRKTAGLPEMQEGRACGAAPARHGVRHFSVMSFLLF